ncbi:MAG: FliG C-terminal domain-containing protein [Planctomycetota bacterium]
MAYSGRQKAAVLLMNLDKASATKLLSGLPSEEVEEIGVELARLDASGQRDLQEENRITQAFVDTLAKGHKPAANIRSFLSETLLTAVDKDRADQINARISKASRRKDPFSAIRSASTDELVLALEGEHPQTIAVVLSEMSPTKGQEVLSLLSEELRNKAICKMTNQDMIQAGVRERMASMISTKLKTFEGETLLERPEVKEQNLRKLALVLSGLEQELRDQLLDEIKNHDEEMLATVRRLMVTWGDIPSIADRSLQEALRGIDATRLAMALYGADEQIAKKIRANISERAAAMLDEETALLQEPLPKEIAEAQDEVCKPLRDANEEGKLRFMQR